MRHAFRSHVARYSALYALAVALVLFGVIFAAVHFIGHAWTR